MSPLGRQPENLDDFGRFTEPALLILISLAGGQKHGYAITDDIEGMTGFRPGPGTLYGAVSRLETRGFIEAVESQDRRKPYRLTASGRKALEARLAALEAVTKTGQARLAGA